MSEPIIRVRGLRKRFEQIEAVAGLDFEIAPGSVAGFIGANGSGKTTTMRILVSLDQPTSGTARVGGFDVVRHPAEVRRLVGWMPDAFGSYPHMTVADYLDFFGRAYGLKRSERQQRVEEVMDFADLTAIAAWPMSKLSKGMAQRLCFGRTLIHDPQVLVLDEPAAGLDPKARIEFKRLVRILADRGKTIFISSHILSELGEMCDSLLFIDAGQLVHHGSSESLKRGGQERAIVDVRLAGEPQRLAEWAQTHAGWRMVEPLSDGGRLEFESVDPTVLAGELRRMILDGLPVAEFHRRERRLEDAFVDLLRERRGANGSPPPLLPLADNRDESAP